MTFLVCFLALVASVNAVMKCGDVSLANNLKLDSFQPACDVDGDYKPVQCRDGWCSCVNKAGMRLDNYGVPDILSIDGIMDCKCALAKDSGSHMGLSQKCLYNGNFPPECFDASLLTPIGERVTKCDGRGMYGAMQMNDGGDECYCSQPDQLRPISQKYRAKGDDCKEMGCECARDELETGEDKGCSALGNYPSECTMTRKQNPWMMCDNNGDFSAIQCNTYKCYCADKNTGQRLGSYEFVKNSTDHRLANCKCAIHQVRYSAVDLEMNICKSNGNYESCSMNVSRQLVTQGSFVNLACNCVGLYKPVQCDNEWCYCSNQYGYIDTRYWASLQNKSKMRCDCARQEDEFIRNSTLRIYLDCDRFGNFPPQRK